MVLKCPNTIRPVKKCLKTVRHWKCCRLRNKMEAAIDNSVQCRRKCNCRAHLVNCAFDQMCSAFDQMCALTTCIHARHFVEVRIRVRVMVWVGVRIRIRVGVSVRVIVGALIKSADTQRIWSNAQIDQMCLTSSICSTYTKLC